MAAVAVLVGVSLAYFTSGRLGLLLAVPPGYATAIWPPSGIAFAAALLLGPRVLPAIWLGSFAVNLSLGGNASGLLQPALVASGAALQAAAGVWMTRRLGVAFPLITNDTRVFKALLVGGPLACTINATLGTVSLLMTEAIGPGGVLVNWGTWWVGDTIGVLVFTPVLLIAFERTGPPRRARLLSTLPHLAMFTVVVLLFIDASGREQRSIRNQFDARVDGIAERLRDRLSAHALGVDATAAFVASTPELDRERFGGFARELLAELRSVRSLQWSVRVPPHTLAAFEQRVRAQGQPGFRVHEFGAVPGQAAELDPARQRTVILYLEPLAGNEAAFGYDIRSNPAIRSTLDAAMARRDAAASPPIRLVQEPANARGVVLYHPVFNGDPLPAGYVAAVLRVPDLLRQSLMMARESSISLSLWDVTDDASGDLLHGDDSIPGAADAAMRAVAPIAFGHRRWELRAKLAPAYLLANRNWQAWWLLVGGLLMTAVLGLLFLVLGSRNERVQELVIERTRELTAANRALREREASMERLLVELRRSEQKLRSSAGRLEESNRELEQFAHLASHDLKAPLRSVSSFTQLLERRLGDALDDDSAEYLRFIRRGVRAMHELTDDLLALSRIRHESLNARETMLREVVDEAIQALHADIQASGCEIEIDDLPLLSIDASLIRQVFQNLISNSIKFAREGEAPRIRIDCRGERDGWRIDVRDHGIGIEPEHRQKVFRIFTRLHGPEQYAGTGVGLALCEKIVQLHRGQIGVVDCEGPGTLVSIWLPGAAGV